MLRSSLFLHIHTRSCFWARKASVDSSFRLPDFFRWSRKRQQTGLCLVALLKYKNKAFACLLLMQQQSPADVHN